jgi:hypothetical protein
LTHIRSAKSPIKLFSSMDSNQGYNTNLSRGQPKKYFKFFNQESPSLGSGRIYKNDLRSPEKLKAIFGSNVDVSGKSDVSRQKKQFERFVNYSSVKGDCTLPAENSVGLFSGMGPTPDSNLTCPDSR